LTLRLALHPQSLLKHISLRMLSELIVLVVLVIAALWVIVAAAEPYGSKLFYVIFLPIVVAAVRYGLDGACISLAATQLVLVGLLHRYGYEASAFAEFQLLMLVLSATGLTVGVVVTERQRAYETVRDVERQLRAKEVEASQAARLNLASGTAAALAHEINQPMTADPRRVYLPPRCCRSIELPNRHLALLVNAPPSAAPGAGSTSAPASSTGR
jgi:two-component system, LuxR family, sensor kinase FixL